MHRIKCPTPGLAKALALFIQHEGHTASVTYSQGLDVVLAEAPTDIVNAACIALSVETADQSATSRYYRSHYAWSTVGV